MTRSDHVTCVIPMYRGGTVTARVVSALVSCRLPMNTCLSVVVVDDASDDGSADHIEALNLPCVRVVTQPVNSGRSAARNRGAREAGPGWLLFVDSDCEPADANFILEHLTACSVQGRLSMGAVTGTDDGFWHEYQAAASRRRRLLAGANKAALVGSSQNFMLDREAFLDVGGFDESYQAYGFEDRDLFLRLADAGIRSIATPTAAVIHRDRLDLRSVCRKMAEAGGSSAVRFATHHPAAYQELGYASLDGRLHTSLRLLEPVIFPVARVLLPWLETRLEVRWLPFCLKRRLVRALVAASYLHGTVHDGGKDFLST